MTENKAYQLEYAAFLVRLKQARKDSGLTQRDVAKKLGRAKTFISKVELGERRVDFIELKELARLYGKEMSYFD
jgi:transcriptional regulator with XRE-family HTH domain